MRSEGRRWALTVLVERWEVVEKALMDGAVKAPCRACRIDCIVVGNAPLARCE